MLIFYKMVVMILNNVLLKNLCPNRLLEEMTAIFMFFSRSPTLFSHDAEQNIPWETRLEPNGKTAYQNHEREIFLIMARSTLNYIQTIFILLTESMEEYTFDVDIAAIKNILNND